VGRGNEEEDCRNTKSVEERKEEFGGAADRLSEGEEEVYSSRGKEGKRREIGGDRGGDLQKY
jgi:hypothetical protein